MNIEEMLNRLENDGYYEAIYKDSEGREVVVIRSLDLYGFVSKLLKRERDRCASLAEIEGMAAKDIVRAIRDS